MGIRQANKPTSQLASEHLSQQLRQRCEAGGTLGVWIDELCQNLMRLCKALAMDMLVHLAQHGKPAGHSSRLLPAPGSACMHSMVLCTPSQDLVQPCLVVMLHGVLAMQLLSSDRAGSWGQPLHGVASRGLLPR